MFSIMRLNEIIAAERSIRPLLTACDEIKLPCSSVSQVALFQVNQTAAALYYLPRSQLAWFFFSPKRNACCTKLVKDDVDQMEKQTLVSAILTLQSCTVTWPKQEAEQLINLCFGASYTSASWFDF